MAGSNKNKAGVSAPPLHRFARVTGVVTAACGALVITSWHAHWTWFLQMIPDTAPMQYNTALCFMLVGAALFFVAGTRKLIGAWLGGSAALFTLLTLFEYLFGTNLGIDQVFFTPYFTVATKFPGRMSPLAAVCFIFVGGGFALAQTTRLRQTVMTCVGILACVVAEIACVALLGYLAGISAAYGWGAYSQMAFNTAALFLLLASGMMAWALQAARIEGFDFRHLLPVSGSVALMVMIAIVSANGALELQSATFWRKHTFDVILSTQAFEENLLDIQRGLRNYVTSGDTNALESYRTCLHAEPKQLKGLAELTADNPVQTQRLLNLSAAMEKVVAADESTLATYGRLGRAAMVSDPLRDSRTAFTDARTILRIFMEEEKSLLFTRDNKEQENFRGVSRLLIFGSAMAVVLLLAAYYMASHQMKLRRRIEVEREKLIAQLQKALTEVKTLSGMIPICAWCKNIRSDEGFWQSVEEYVGSHTKAEFSHGMCPKCAEKIHDELKNI